MKPTRSRTATRLFASTFALALAASPLSIMGGNGIWVAPAFAKDGGGSGGGDHSGSGDRKSVV